MGLKTEQKIVLIYSILGASVALTSSFFTSSLSPVNNLFIAFLFPVLIYLVALGILLKTVKHKRVKSLLYNSFMSYFLLWLVIWILLYNL